MLTKVILVRVNHCQWHPHKPFLAATGIETGHIYVWSIVAPQRWSALAPDFAEVEENVEYVEREDEFDIHPIEEIHKRILHQEDEDIDVLTIDPVKKASGFDEGDFQMPVLLDVEDSDSGDEVVAIGTGQFRRKSPGQGKEWALEDGADGSADEGGSRRSNASPRLQNAPKRRRGDG